MFVRQSLPRSAASEANRAIESFQPGQLSYPIAFPVAAFRAPPRKCAGAVRDENRIYATRTATGSPVFQERQMQDASPSGSKSKVPRTERAHRLWKSHCQKMPSPARALGRETTPKPPWLL